MLVRCPQCDRQHRVADALAGKRAKCSCGAVLSIPAAAETPDDDPLGSLDSPAPRPSDVSAEADAEGVLCEFRYGQAQSRFLWLFSVAGIIGAVLVPVGIFWNDGWEINHVPLPPWGATLVAESAGIGCLLMFVYIVGGNFYSRSHRKRVAITAGAVLVPRGVFTTEERVLPLREISLKVRDVGPTSHAYLKHGGGTVRLTAFLFPTDADYDRFLQVLQRQVGGAE